MKLFICEKPSQAKDIAPHIGANTRGDGCMTGNGVAITWCVGHLMEQSPPEYYNPALKSWDIKLLPVIPTTWHIGVKPDLKKQYDIVARLIKSAESVVIATDADSEGEVIAREVLDHVGYTGLINRLWLAALDDASIKKALSKLLPNEKTLPLYWRGLGRARADWIAGMNLTMSLTKAFGTGGKGGTLHCGRVQTPVLGLIVRREREIKVFNPKKHYDLDAVFEIEGKPVPFNWVKPKGLLDEAGHIVDAAKVKAIADTLKNALGTVQLVDTTPQRELAPLPFSLGALQRAASARFGMKAQTVLDVAQSLYEKHKATSYPRTDAEHLPTSMFAEARGVVDALNKVDPELGSLVEQIKSSDALNKAGRAFNDKKITAHHAIIPTANLRVILKEMNSNERVIYQLIRDRYLMQFLGDFEYDQTRIEVSCQSHSFVVTGKAPTRQGWRVLEPLKTEADKAKAKDLDDAETSEVAVDSLPQTKVGAAAPNLDAQVKALKTKPPKRYTEGTLLGAMESIDKVIDDPRLKAIMKGKEKAGIGTDATRASIIEGLFKREYIANDKKAIVPTDKGDALITLIEKVSPAMVDPALTALWEELLAQVEAGQLSLEKFEASLAKFVGDSITTIKSVSATGTVARIGVIHASSNKSGQSERSAEEYPCPVCGKGYLRQLPRPRGGFFWGCNRYREADGNCKATFAELDGKPDLNTGARLANLMLARKVSGIKVSETSPKIGKPCPKCGTGKQTGRSHKATGKPYVGCTNYPNCNFFEWVKI